MDRPKPYLGSSQLDFLKVTLDLKLSIGDISGEVERFIEVNCILIA
jgi:hypothetical protein